MQNTLNTPDNLTTLQNWISNSDALNYIDDASNLITMMLQSATQYANNTDPNAIQNQIDQLTNDYNAQVATLQTKIETVVNRMTPPTQINTATVTP
jgi:esterase/lipase